MTTQQLKLSELAKIIEKEGYTLIPNPTWKAFTNKMFYLEEEVKRLQKLNDKYRKEIKEGRK